MVAMPPTKKPAKIQDDIWASDSPPLIPISSKIATGAVAANRKEINPVLPWSTEKSPVTRPRPAMGRWTASMAENAFNIIPNPNSASTASPLGPPPDCRDLHLQ